MDEIKISGEDESSARKGSPSRTEFRTPGKRIRIGSTPEFVQQQPPARVTGRASGQDHSEGKQGATDMEMRFPPFTLRFDQPQAYNDRQLGTTLVNCWNEKHGRNLNITVRFGHLKSLLVFANDVATFEDLLVTSRWPSSLDGSTVNVARPRILPPDYSLVIRQFHKSWNESEYPSLLKLTRMYVKDGTSRRAAK